MSRTMLLVALICAVLLTLLALVCGPDAAGAEDPSPSASPSPSPAATHAPLPTWQQVRHALRVRAKAAAARQKLAKARRCFDRPMPALLQPKPLRGASAAVWAAAERSWQHRAGQWARRYERLRRLMVHPGGRVAARWKPLALWCGWPRSCWPTLCYVISRESGGNPNAVNPSSLCAGLLQIHPCHHVANVLNPEVNLRAGLRLWRASGWSPWAVM